ncbi:unnamed protein product [Protopolystoma xenopodis]|uniref:Uncharacterized protein n=1 Tax=Protopolystoma xenopodis TaxID=117903 RepID=A0A3S5B781_9PLAT|nr:unnamed protein product [Protopolystoma xenopodis]
MTAVVCSAYSLTSGFMACRLTRGDEPNMYQSKAYQMSVNPILFLLSYALGFVLPVSGGAVLYRHILDELEQNKNPNYRKAFRELRMTGLLDVCLFGGTQLGLVVRDSLEIAFILDVHDEASKPYQWAMCLSLLYPVLYPLFSVCSRSHYQLKSAREVCKSRD